MIITPPTPPRTPPTMAGTIDDPVGVEVSVGGGRGVGGLGEDEGGGRGGEVVRYVGGSGGKSAEYVIAIDPGEVSICQTCRNVSKDTNVGNPLIKDGLTPNRK